MFKFLFIHIGFCLLLISSQIYAGDNQPDANDQTGWNAVQRVRENCLENIDWSARRCEMRNQTGEMYQTNTANNVMGHFALGAAGFTSEVLDEVFDVARAQSNIIYYVYDRPEMIRREILSQVSGYAEGKEMSQCQKACLVKCAAANILQYEFTLSTKFGPVENGYDSGTGVCTEFSRIADDIGEELGLEVQMAYGFRHAFNRFRINGEWYYAEPQSSACQFFKREQLSQAELGVAEMYLNQEPRPLQAISPPTMTRSYRRTAEGRIVPRDR